MNREVTTAQLEALAVLVGKELAEQLAGLHRVGSKAKGEGTMDEETIRGWIREEIAAALKEPGKDTGRRTIAGDEKAKAARRSGLYEVFGTGEATTTKDIKS